ncbi:hypothetical protein KCU81_g67, partial [Aureobasidium melanogenum]
LRLMTRWEACLLDSYACRTVEDDWNTQQRRQPVSPAFVNIWNPLVWAQWCSPSFCSGSTRYCPNRSSRQEFRKRSDLVVLRRSEGIDFGTKDRASDGKSRAYVRQPSSEFFIVECERLCDSLTVEEDECLSWGIREEADVVQPELQGPLDVAVVDVERVVCFVNQGELVFVFFALSIVGIVREGGSFFLNLINSPIDFLKLVTPSCAITNTMSHNT